MNWIGLKTFVIRDIQRFLRVPIQALVTPWVSAFLYIFVFGYVVGQNIDLIAGVRYIDFVLPGILMMNVITASFSQSSSSLYFQRFVRHIEEILTAPLSHFEMIIGYVIGSVMRGIIVGLGIFIISVLFSAAHLANFWLFLCYVVSVSIAFSLIGLVVGLWANQFEHLSVLNVFVIMPLSFVGGVFNSLAMLPEALRTFAVWNPFFYFMDGIRYSMIGVHEASLTTGFLVIGGIIAVAGAIVWYLFSIGWRLRE